MLFSILFILNLKAEPYLLECQVQKENYKIQSISIDSNLTLNVRNSEISLVEKKISQADWFNEVIYFNIPGSITSLFQLNRQGYHWVLTEERLDYHLIIIPLNCVD